MSTSVSNSTLCLHPHFLPWLKEHARGYDAVVLDVDGVLTVGKQALPGADELLSWLDERDMPFMVLTNDGSRSQVERAAYLARRGLTLDPTRIVSCSEGIREWVNEYPDYRGKRFFVVATLGNPCYGEMAGLRIEHDPDQLQACDGVILGEGPYDWRKLQVAVINFLRRNPDAPFLVPNPDDVFKIQNDDLYPGAGGIARFICRMVNTQGTCVEPIFLGKPYPTIFQCCLHDLESRYQRAFEPSRILMVGDSLTSDIAGAKGVGWQAALILTGITHEGMISSGEISADYIFRRL